MKRFDSIMFSACACLVSLLLVSCWEDDVLPEEDPVGPQSTISLSQDGIMHQFVYNGYEPLKDKSVTVFYQIPKNGNMKTMPILFVFPGESRDADTHLQLFSSWANSKGVMIFALQYSTELYPTTTEYILGGMNTRQSSSGLLPREQWNFNYVESLFQEIVRFTQGNQKTYDMWGHSAGAQFVHRYVTFMPDAHIGKAVACNSGWYTMPDLAIEFPYGLQKVTGADSEMQQKSLSRKLYVYVGGADTSTAGLNDNEGSRAQGKNRNERGRYYYQQSQQIAKQLGFSFGWTFAEVPGVGHDPSGMAQGSRQVFE